jgi:hypothetical protein
MRRGESQRQQPLSGLPSTPPPLVGEWPAPFLPCPCVAFDGDAVSEEEAIHTMGSLAVVSMKALCRALVIS